MAKQINNFKKARLERIKYIDLATAKSEAPVNKFIIQIKQ